MATFPTRLESSHDPLERLDLLTHCSAVATRTSRSCAVERSGAGTNRCVSLDRRRHALTAVPTEAAVVRAPLDPHAACGGSLAGTGQGNREQRAEPSDAVCRREATILRRLARVGGRADLGRFSSASIHWWASTPCVSSGGASFAPGASDAVADVLATVFDLRRSSIVSAAEQADISG